MASIDGYREMAKRILRSRGIIYSGDVKFATDLTDYLIKASDINPKVNVEMEIQFKTNGLPIKITPMGAHGIFISKDPPQSDDLLWIWDDIPYVSKNLMREIQLLASAGYPGCIGCVDNTPWSESKWRDIRLNQ